MDAYPTFLGTDLQVPPEVVEQLTCSQQYLCSVFGLNL